MPITFYDKKEALEYAQLLGQEGRASTVKEETTTKGNKLWVIYSGGVAEKRSASYRYEEETDEDVISFSGRPSTHMRLHEMGHAAHKHRDWAFSGKDIAREEMQAETWARKKMGGKPITTEFLMSVASTIIKEFGGRPNTVFRAVTQAAKAEGHKLSDTQKSRLWEYVRTYRQRWEEESEGNHEPSS